MTVFFFRMFLIDLKTNGFLRTTEFLRSSTPNIEILSQTQYRVYDGLLAAGLCLCFLIGLTGNCISLTYFIRSKKRNLPTLLYITACCIDIVSCVIHLPVTASLLNNRNPSLLGNKAFCGIWYFASSCGQVMSMFVVTILSVTRAIAIVFPFYKIKKSTILYAIVLAFLYIICWEITYILKGEYYYSRALTYCEFDKKIGFFENIVHINHSILLGVPPLMVFFTTITVTCNLKTKNRVNASRINFREVSVTIICFSMVFLICNILTFINMVLLTYTHFVEKG